MDVRSLQDLNICQFSGWTSPMFVYIRRPGWVFTFVYVACVCACVRKRKRECVWEKEREKQSEGEKVVEDLTDLVPQHPLQPVLPSSSQVDGQRGSAALHHHHSLRQQLVRQTHNHLGGWGENTNASEFWRLKLTTQYNWPVQQPWSAPLPKVRG